MLLAPITFKSFTYQGRTLQLSTLITFQPILDAGGFYGINDDKQLGMNTTAYGESIEELIDNLNEAVFFNWDTYALANPKTLRNGQRNFRAALLHHLTEPASTAVSYQDEDLAEPGNYASDFINLHEFLRNTPEGIISLYGSGLTQDEELL